MHLKEGITNMIDENYIENSSYISKIVEGDNVYITFKTDFEKMNVIYNAENLFTGIGNLIRFINTEYYDFYGDEKLCAAYFLPSHIAERLQECLDREETILDPVCNKYLPDDMQMKTNKGNNDKIENMFDTIKSSMRASYSTSFYFCDNQDKNAILKGIHDLKKEIIAIKDYDVAVGSIEVGCGIVEKSRHNKTDDPETVHCNFWKFNSNKSFDDIAKNFKILG